MNDDTIGMAQDVEGLVLLALGWTLGTLFGVMLVLVWEMTK